MKIIIDNKTNFILFAHEVDVLISTGYKLLKFRSCEYYTHYVAILEKETSKLKFGDPMTDDERAMFRYVKSKKEHYKQLVNKKKNYEHKQN